MPISPDTLQENWLKIRILALSVLVICAIISLGIGAVNIDFSQLLAWFSGDANAQNSLILSQLRLPRILLAVLVGALLASSGAITQGLFRNPLADPSIIGVSAGATAGASLAIVLLNQSQLQVWGLSLVSLSALVGSAIAVSFVYRLATNASGTSVSTMLLAGMGITFLAAGLSSLLEFFASNQLLKNLSLWRMGGLDTANYSRLVIVAIVGLWFLISLPKYMKALNVLLLGESEARHLGLNVNRIKKQLMWTVAAGVGVSVATTGTIAFIGLVVPHLIRLLCGPNHIYLLPLSAITGALLLVVADTLARVLIAPSELPVGLLTVFIGAPLFISLLRHRHQYGMQH